MRDIIASIGVKEEPEKVKQPEVKPDIFMTVYNVLYGK